MHSKIYYKKSQQGATNLFPAAPESAWSPGCLYCLPLERSPATATHWSAAASARWNCHLRPSSSTLLLPCLCLGLGALAAALFFLRLLWFPPHRRCRLHILLEGALQVSFRTKQICVSEHVWESRQSIQFERTKAHGFQDAQFPHILMVILQNSAGLAPQCHWARSKFLVVTAQHCPNRVVPDIPAS